MSRPRPIRDARGRFVRRASAPQQGEAIAAPSSAWTIHAVGLEAVDPTPALRCEILPLAHPRLRVVAGDPVTVHGVLAGAYRGSRAALLTHASEDGGATAVCGGVLPGNLCDVEEPEPPTCERCARWWRGRVWRALNELRRGRTRSAPSE